MNKLLEFNKLSKKEVIRLRHYITPKYHNTNENAVELFEYLAGLHPNITEKDVTDKRISFAVYKEKIINHVKIRKLISNLLKIFKAFLALNEIENNPGNKKIHYLKALHFKDMNKMFIEGAEELRKNFHLAISSGENFYEDILRLYHQLSIHLFIHNYGNFVKNLEPFERSLDDFYIFMKLYIAVHTVDTDIYLSTGLRKGISSYKVIADVEKEKEYFMKYHPAIIVYYYHLLLLITNEDNYIYKLQDYCKKKSFNPYLAYISNNAIEGYLRKKLTGENVEDADTFREMLFEIYNSYFMESDLFLKFAVEQDVGKIPEDIFTAVVAIGIALKKYKWADEFIEKYFKYINSNNREALYNYSKARIYFSVGEYVKALQHLSKVSNVDSQYHRISKLLYVCIYTEQGEYEAALSIIDSLRKYTAENQTIIPAAKRKLKTTVKYFTKLLKLKEGRYLKVSKELELFRDELENEKMNFYYKEWMKGQLVVSS